VGKAAAEGRKGDAPVTLILTGRVSPLEGSPNPKGHEPDARSLLAKKVKRIDHPVTIKDGLSSEKNDKTGKITTCEGWRKGGSGRK